MNVSTSRHRAEVRPGSGGDAFAEIVTMAQDMLSAARAGDWEDVARLDTLRQERIAAAFPPSGEPQDAGDAVLCIETLLNIDREVVELARARMGVLGTELDALQRGRRAQQAYGQTAPGG